MCRGCVSDRWGQEALVITEDDGRLGFGRSAVIERHRLVQCYFRVQNDYQKSG